MPAEIYVTASVMLALLISSPVISYQITRPITPALEVRRRLVRGFSEGLVGFGGVFLFSVMVGGMLYQESGVSNIILAPFLLLLNLAIGYAQIRRGFKVMGAAIVLTGILLAAVLMLG